jgi:hypothetical protein
MSNWPVSAKVSPTGGRGGESEPPTFLQDQFCNYFKTGGGVARIYALYLKTFSYVFTHLESSHKAFFSV